MAKLESTLDNLGSFKDAEEKKELKELNLIFLRKNGNSINADPIFYSQRVIDIANKKKYDILVDYYNSLYLEERLLSLEEKDEIVQKIADKTKEIDSLIILGTTLFKKDNRLFSSNPILYKGDYIEYFRKRIDFDWTHVASKNNLIPIKGKQGNVINWKGWRIGFENCKDVGELKKYLLRTGQEPVDLQLISAYNYLHIGGFSAEDVAVKNNGYILMYDSLRDRQGIFAFKVYESPFLSETFRYKEITEKLDRECNGISFRIRKD